MDDGSKLPIRTRTNEARELCFHTQYAFLPQGNEAIFSWWVKMRGKISNGLLLNHPCIGRETHEGGAFVGLVRRKQMFRPVGEKFGRQNFVSGSCMAKISCLSQ